MMKTNHEHADARESDAQSSDAHEELAWQAFCYLANELNTADRLAFETRLENDVVACEALAQAVELTASIHAAEVLAPVPQVVRPAGKTQPQLAWWLIGAGTAAAVLALLAVVGSQWPDQSSVAAIAQNDVVTTELAVAWSQSLPADVADSSSTNLDLPAGVASTVDATTAGTDGTETAAMEELPPSWMLAAVRGLAETEENMDSDMNTAGPFGNETSDN